MFPPGKQKERVALSIWCVGVGQERKLQEDRESVCKCEFVCVSWNVFCDFFRCGCFLSVDVYLWDGYRKASLTLTQDAFLRLTAVRRVQWNGTSQGLETF